MASVQAGGDGRLPFSEQLKLVELPTGTREECVARYMSTRRAYLPGEELDVHADSVREGKAVERSHTAAYGGQVYAQSALATCRVLAADEKKRGVGSFKKLGLHTIHGFFTVPGKTDRPFIYDVKPVTLSKGFGTMTVTGYQPASPSTNPVGDHYPLADGSLPLGPPCFTAITSFKSAEPHTAGGTADFAESPPQARFSGILDSRPPTAWPPAPPVDIDLLTEFVGTDIVGNFPICDMKKVDMSSYNKGKSLHERRELILYRLLEPLPPDEDANSHIVVHAYTADRNGLLMLGNQMGIGKKFGRAASLSYSLVVHVNASDAIMRGDGWWVQEVMFPRAAAGRGIVESKIWSPEGLHVATEYQDGLVQAYESRRNGRATKL